MSTYATVPTRVSVLPDGTALARYCMTLGESRGDTHRALMIAERLRDTPTVKATLERLPAGRSSVQRARRLPVGHPHGTGGTAGAHGYARRRRGGPDARDPRLRADQARRWAASEQDDRDAVLGALIGELVADDAFSAADLMARAVTHLALRQALACAGASNGRRLGHLLVRLEAGGGDGIHFLRIGADRNGVVWRVVRG